MTDPRPDLPRIVFAILIICGLLTASLWVVAPFAAALVWATTIVVATWPLLLRLQRLFGGRRGPATAVLTLALLLLVVVPFLLALGTLLGNRDTIAIRVEQLRTAQLPPAPEWVAGIPLVGGKAAAAWNGLAGTGLRDLATKAAPHTRQAVNWFFAAFGSLAGLFGQLLMTVVVAAVLYSLGDQAADRTRRFARRIGGDRGEAAVVLAGQAIRGVALGVVVTAVVQTTLAGAGLAIAGVPFAGVLTVVVLVLCIAQVGPVLVLVPAIVWLYGSGQAGWGTFLLVWSVPVLTLDNVLRPILIKKGADLPLLLIFAGVIGGLVSFGLIGIFVGPVVLAVSHRLLEAWIDAEDPQAITGG
ncbi:MAG TPA: AI-2E family transporter YdiK [Thermoanaerobaculia bacterium]|nr:AI-2E family transporter YdiK [Thermoanaerobaculia bacterium]HQR66636.1 AI-2E family transporter YdiK [Thermoanaerobaculia bacterium]